jgi:cyclic pyranopterin phosphate synthase
MWKRETWWMSSSSVMSMIDRFGRPIDNLRISLTQKCNMACFYCHGEGEVAPNGEMTAAEIEKIVSVCVRNGIRKIKLTGGEPLLRNDIAVIVSRIAPMVQEVSMTTNGVLLSRHARALKDAGLARVNVSLDTLSHERFLKITGTDTLDKVRGGIEAAFQAGLTPLKINMVVTRMNADEISDMIDFMREGMVLQLIEFVAPREDERLRSLFFDLSPIERELESRALRVAERTMHRRKKYFVPQEVEVVRSVHNTSFCGACNRLRLTSDGFLKPCLLRSDNHINIREHLGSDDSILDCQFRKAVEMREPYWR